MYLYTDIEIMKYLRITLTKYLQNLFTENYKKLVREIKDVKKNIVFMD